MSDSSKRYLDVLVDVGKIADEVRNSSNRTIFGGLSLERVIEIAELAAYQERTEVIREGLKTLAVLVSRK